ncbi:MAG TPA: response regulator transcription factor [Candidatus Dormibacteraeota bacterium]|nr:response regulator transcription factor [Candidatus Dormibacteraeota bacterium]
MIRILLADDHEIVRMALSQTISESDPEWEICGEAIDGRDAIEKAKALKPNLVVLDFAMPMVDGITAAREIRALSPDIAILVYTFMIFPKLEEMAHAAGIHSVVQKADTVGLLAEIRKLVAPKPAVGAESALDQPTGTKNRAAIPPSQRSGC